MIKPDPTQEILHKLDHEKLEIIGVEELAAETTSTIMLIGMAAMRLQSAAQVIGLLEFTLDKFKRGACDDCRALAVRIAAELSRQYNDATKEE